MSFLSKLNESKNAAANTSAKPAPKVNPFAKNPFMKNNPFAKKTETPKAEAAPAEVVKVEKKVEAPKAVKETKAPETEVRDGRAPSEKPKVAPIELPETETEKLAKSFLSGEKKPVPLKGQEEADIEDETAEPTPEEKFEAEADSAVKAVVAEDVEPEATDEKAEPETEAEEAPKKKTRKRKTKKAEETEEAATEDAVAEESENDNEDTAHVENPPAKLEKKTDSQRVLQTAHFKPVDILGQKMSYDEACQLVMTQFNDTNAWKQYEDDVLAQLDSKELRIEADMNPGTLKAVECNLDALATDLLRNYIKTKQLNELLTNKDFGTAYALMAEYSDGKNIIDRQQSGFRALASTEIGDQKVNMLALIATTRVHLVFLQAVMDRIKSKQNMCITMSSAIKVENSMSMLGAQG